MGPLDLIFGQIQRAISDHSSPNTPGPSYDANPLLGQLSSIFGQTAQQHGLPFDASQFGFGGDNQNYNQGGYNQGGVAPSSQDPFGDPADGGGFSNAGYGQGGIAPSSQDPFGDPADGGQQSAFGDIAPASQDPFGDPADQGRY